MERLFFNTLLVVGLLFGLDAAISADIIKVTTP